MKITPRLTGFRAGVIGTAAVLLLYSAHLPFISLIEMKIFDGFYRIRGPLAPSGEVVLVAIDRKSIEQKGRWPWSRAVIAGLIDECSRRGARVIGLDIVFSEREEKAGADAELARSIRESGRAVLGYFFFTKEGEGEWQRYDAFRDAYERISCSRVKLVRTRGAAGKGSGDLKGFAIAADVEPLPRDAAGCGFLNVIYGTDGVVREMPPVIRCFDDYFLAFPLAVLGSRLGNARTSVLRGRDAVEAVSVGDVHLFPDERGLLHINYLGPADGFPAFSAVDVLKGDVPPGALEGKIVLVGGTSVGSFSTMLTPWEPAASSVYIHATVVENLLRNDYLRVSPFQSVGDILSIIAVGLLLSALLSRQPGAGGRLLTSLAAGAVYLCAVYSLFAYANRQWGLMYPLAAAAACYVSVTLYSHFSLESEGKRLKRAVGEFSGMFSAAHDAEALLPRILDTFRSFTGAERGLLITLRKKAGAGRAFALGDRLDAMTAKNFNHIDLAREEFAAVKGIIEKVARSGEPVLSGEHGSGAAGVPGIRALLCLPLGGGTPPDAVVYLDSARGDASIWEKNLPLVESFARQAAAALRACRGAPAPGAGAAAETPGPRPRTPAARYEGIIGESAAIRRVYDLMAKAINSDITVLIGGETGTGKELIARAIHFCGPRRERAFLAQNCAALPETLLESELFGHTKGSFTNAVADKKGLFELADRGTILLDEIGETSPAMQAKLLRVLQDGYVRPIGSSREIRVDVRLISATNKNLKEEVEKGSFRGDLFWRLDVFPIYLPPLRERRDDIPLLAFHFMDAVCARTGKRLLGFTDEALELLFEYDYPGNVRELENEIEKAVLLAPEGGRIGAGTLSPRFRKGVGAVGILEAARAGKDKDLKQAIAEFEQSIIRFTLRKHKGNKSKAAKVLGLSRTGLIKKLKRYGIS